MSSTTLKCFYSLRKLLLHPYFTNGKTERQREAKFKITQIKVGDWPFNPGGLAPLSFLVAITPSQFSLPKGYSAMQQEFTAAS